MHRASPSVLGGTAADPRVERVRGMAARVARSHDLDIFDVELKREAGGWLLRIILDRPVQRDSSGAVLVESLSTAIGLDECQRVSEDLGTLLDVEDALDRAYTLEVSSPGLDRPLRNVDDYRRFTGRRIKLVVPEGVDGQKHFEGRLQGVEDEAVLVETQPGRVRHIPLRIVSRARLGVEF
ncbi:MAG: ribosome maturation factor RimP [Luteitalea sp.]|nr:ribosome maturation factor RimP [Luteitalea sp.]